MISKQATKRPHSPVAQKLMFDNICSNSFPLHRDFFPQRKQSLLLVSLQVLFLLLFAQTPDQYQSFSFYFVLLFLLYSFREVATIFCSDPLEPHLSVSLWPLLHLSCCPSYSYPVALCRWSCKTVQISCETWNFTPTIEFYPHGLDSEDSGLEVALDFFPR